MAAKNSILLLLLTLLSTAHSSSSSPSSFIKSSCSITRYPALCIASLSSYSDTIQKSPKQIAQAALTVSLSKARSTTAYVVQMSKATGMKKWESQVMKDCVDNMRDSVDRLSTSVTEFGEMHNTGNEESFMWHMSNVQTWVSAALTDENTCMDEFSGHPIDAKLKASIRGRIIDVARVTSNGLALVNRFAERH